MNLNPSFGSRMKKEKRNSKPETPREIQPKGIKEDYDWQIPQKISDQTLKSLQTFIQDNQTKWAILDLDQKSNTVPTSN